MEDVVVREVDLGMCYQGKIKRIQATLPTWVLRQIETVRLAGGKFVSFVYVDTLAPSTTCSSS